MSKYVENCWLSPFDRVRLHNQSCTWLLTKVMDIFRSFKTEDMRGDNVVFQQMLMQIETNIWTCIYRICDFNRERIEAKQKQDQESQKLNQHQLTGYSSAADEYEAVLLKTNMSIINEDSDASGAERKLKKIEKKKAIQASQTAAPPPVEA